MLEVGPYEGGCIACRLFSEKDLKQHKRALSDQHKTLEEIVDVIAPDLFESLRKTEKGKVADVLLCPISQRVLALWEGDYCPEWPAL